MISPATSVSLATLLIPTAVNTTLAEVRQVRAEGTPVVSLFPLAEGLERLRKGLARL